MYDVLKKLSSTPTFDNLKLDANTFKHVLAENIVFVTKAFKNRLVIPAFDAFCENITRLVYSVICNLRAFHAVYVTVPKQSSEYQNWKHTEVSLPVWLFN